LAPYNNISASKKYTHLSHQEREIIMCGLSADKSIRKISRELKRTPSTVLREIRRNADGRSGLYRALLAKRKAKKKRSEASSRERIPNHDDREYIEKKLKEGWSPEQIAGRRNLEENRQIYSHETVYQYIFNVKPELHQHLLRAKQKRRKRGTAPNKHAPRIKNKTSIEERPESVNLREEVGHWEADTMVSRQSKAALCVLTERSLNVCLTRKILNKTAQEMKNAVVDMLKPFPQEFRKTITFDNGTENAKHQEIDEALGTQSYFCNPYHSWEKGSVENMIGLIRQYLPKKTDLNLIDEEEIDEIEWALNNRPRKRLDYQTPSEALEREGVALTG
jgi:IS30 family transposase